LVGIDTGGEGTHLLLYVIHFFFIVGSLPEQFLFQPLFWGPFFLGWFLSLDLRPTSLKCHSFRPVGMPVFDQSNYIMQSWIQ
jgi:hypothetical protein